jgi:hypothetical protein
MFGVKNSKIKEVSHDDEWDISFNLFLQRQEP